MSVKASAWAWDVIETFQLTIYQAMVLLRLADHANDQGFCWPGKDSLANKCRCSLRKVDEVILQLHDLKLLRIEHRSEGGRSMTNIYHLNLVQADLFTAENPAQHAGTHSMRGRTPEQKTPHTTTENPAQRAPEPSYNHTRNRKEAPAAAPGAPTFWDVGAGLGVPRSLMGKWIRDHSEAKVAECIAAMAVKRPADPVQWGSAWLQDRPKRLYVPEVDDDLVPFARKHGLPAPENHETYKQYRNRLWGIVNQQQGGGPH